MTHESDAFRIATLDERQREELITAYLDDELSPEAAREVTLWLDAHPEHLHGVEHSRRVWDMLDHYPDEPVPEGFAEGVAQQVGLLNRPQRSGVLVGLLAMAASILVAAILGFGALRPDPTDPTTVQVPVEEEPEMLASVPADLLQDMDLLLSLSDDEFQGVLIADLETP